MGRAALLGACTLVVSTHAHELTADNFDKIVAGKAAFIKYQAPWWGHCKKMKPDWDKLMAEFADSKTTVVADVDCTVEKKLCGDNGVSGYPTIKYTDSSGEWQDFQGGRDFDSMKSHAEGLKAPCNYYTEKAACTADQISFIEEWIAKSADDRAAEIKDREEKIKKFDTDFEEGMTELNSKFEETKKKKEAKEIEEPEFKTVVDGLRETYAKNKKTQEDGAKELKPGLSLIKQIKDGKADEL